MFQLVSVVLILLLTLNVFLPPILRLVGYKMRTDILSCGLVGYSGARPGNPLILKALLLQNEERGGDATGWVINNKITKNSDKVGKFLSEHKLKFSEEDENYTFIGHTRKGSVGYKTASDLAHPFGMYKDGVEKENYDLILAMNGTLTNHEALAKEYDVKYALGWVDSDTKIVTKIMAKLGEKDYKKVLEQYKGSMNLLFFSPKHPNVLMVYKDPDRTLFMWQKEVDEIYISSTKEGLQAVEAPDDQIFTFEDNYLHRLNKGKITKKELIVRSPLIPKIVTAHYPAGRYNEYEDYETEFLGEGCGVRSPIGVGNRDKHKTLHLTDARPIDDLLKKTEGKKIHQGHGSNIYAVNDRYHRNGHAQTGKVWVEKSGKVVSHDAKDDPADIKGLTCLWLVNGYACKDRVSYEALMKESTDVNGSFQLSKFKDMRLSEVVKYLLYPAMTTVNQQPKFVLSSDFSDKVKVKGDSFSYSMFLSDQTMKLTYQDLFIPVTKTLVCDLTSVTDNVVASSKETPAAEAKSFLIHQMESNTNNEWKFYFAKYRTDFSKMNDNAVVRRLFFAHMIEVMREADIISSEVVDVFKLGGKDHNFSDEDYIKEFEKAFALYIKQLRKLGHEKEDLEGNTVSDVELANAMSRVPTNEDYINSCQEANSLFNDESFREDFYTAKFANLDKFADEHSVGFKEIERRKFYEAILLLTGFVKDIIPIEELTGALELDIVPLEKKAAEAYDYWKRLNQGVTSNEEEDVEDVVIMEEKTKEGLENDVDIEYREVIEALKDRVTEYDDVNSELKTERSLWLIKNMTDAIGFLEKEYDKKK